uniref:CRIM domain-containing protein n=1 Tax=Mycena chlorophos TaxID=658473 RepID=A0ABQ0LTA9_MYCCL|nr:predicted protein [Mycena chlorophos]
MPSQTRSESRPAPALHATRVSRTSIDSRWPDSEPTVCNSGPTSNPTRLQRHRAERRHTVPAPLFSFDIPSNPLYAAMGLETVLEQLPSEDDTNVAHSLLSFSPRPVRALQRHDSALAAAFQIEHACLRPNPFIEAVAAGGEATGPLHIRVCFPHAKSPVAQVMTLGVPLDSTVEDVIARALSAYWTQGWLPALDEGHRASRNLNTLEWIVLVPGHSGIVEKRIARSKISDYQKFSLFTIVRKPTTQAEKHKIEKQIIKFDLLCAPSVTVPHQQQSSHWHSSHAGHERNRSLPSSIHSGVRSSVSSLNSESLMSGRLP